MWVVKSGGQEKRIYVQQHNEAGQRIAARLQPIDTATVIHLFGWDLPIVKIGGVVVGSGDIQWFKELVSTSSHALSGPWGQVAGTVINVSADLRQSVCQTIRQDLPDTAPVYDVEIEFWRDSFTG